MSTHILKLNLNESFCLQKKDTNVKKIILEKNRLFYFSVFGIFLDNIFKHFPNVEILDLSNNVMTRNEFQCLLEKIRYHSINIRELILRDNKIRTHSTLQFPRISSIEILDLYNNFMTHSGVYHCLTLPNLHTLDISFNKLSKLNWYTFFQNVKNHGKISTFICDGNSIQDCKGLKMLVQDNQVLQYVSLRFNRIQHCTELSKGLCNNKVLKTLLLSQNLINDEGLRNLLQVYHHFRAVYVDNNKIISPFSDQFMNTVKKQPLHIHSLYMNDNLLTQEQGQQGVQLMKLCPNLHMLKINETSYKVCEEYLNKLRLIMSIYFQRFSFFEPKLIHVILVYLKCFN